MVKCVELPHHRYFDYDRNKRDSERCDDERRPITDAQIVAQHPSEKGPHHVHCAMREVHDIKHAEDNTKTKAEHRIE